MYNDWSIEHGNSQLTTSTRQKTQNLTPAVHVEIMSWRNHAVDFFFLNKATPP